MIAVCLCSTLRIIMFSASSNFRYLMTVLLLRPHLSARKEIDAIICPRCRVNLWASCKTSLSSHAAMKSKSSHHLSLSASCHSQCSAIFLFIFIHPSIVHQQMKSTQISMNCCPQ
nr:MAG TPA: hypothetical protein [Bacteriophage sp.]